MLALGESCARLQRTHKHTHTLRAQTDGQASKQASEREFLIERQMKMKLKIVRMTLKVEGCDELIELELWLGN